MSKWKKVLNKQSFHKKKAASVLLKLFIDIKHAWKSTYSVWMRVCSHFYLIFQTLFNIYIFVKFQRLSMWSMRKYMYNTLPYGLTEKRMRFYDQRL